MKFILINTATTQLRIKPEHIAIYGPNGKDSQETTIEMSSGYQITVPMNIVQFEEIMKRTFAAEIIPLPKN